MFIKREWRRLFNEWLDDLRPILPKSNLDKASTSMSNKKALQVFRNILKSKPENKDGGV